ncbi:MAG: hypothetical protein M0Z51_11070 [Propionibacterium sp.]|nr:hypothetical protein [Propionibacterium sp.]
MNPTMAAIRDKDDAHPLGVVGWRSEYHAMRAALDAVLAEHRRVDANGGAWCAVCADPVTQFDTFQMWPCKTVAALTAHLDIEPR